jgi:hypothetical protein
MREPRLDQKGDQDLFFAGLVGWSKMLGQAICRVRHLFILMVVG